jgi:hypothetical protein
VIYNRYVAQVKIGTDVDGRILRKKFFGPRGERTPVAKLDVEQCARPYLNRPNGRRSNESLQAHADRRIAGRSFSRGELGRVGGAVRSNNQSLERACARSGYASA